MYNELIYLKFIKYLFIILVITILMYIYYEIRYYYKLKKKFDNITIKSIKEEDSSIKSIFNSFIKKIDYLLVNIFSKSKMIKEYSLKYDKYKSVNKYNNILTFVKKVEVGFLISLLYLITCILELSHFSVTVYVVLFITGSYLLELSLLIKFRNRLYHLDKELYGAICILEKCYKSGKSTTQSIDYLIKEINEPLKTEFTYIKKDIENGFGIDEAFERMVNRNSTEDIKLVSTYLKVLNSNGGNIESSLKLLSSELLSKQKIKDEFKAETGGTRLTFKILLILPLILISIILIIDPNYFLPLFNSFEGIMLLIIAISLYFLYILLIRKVLGENLWD